MVLLTAVSMAQSGTEWQDPRVNQINRLPMHTSYFAYAVGEQCKESSENYLSINGWWQFNWVENAESRPTDFYSKSFDDKSWDRIQVPGLWEMNGYGDPIYVNIGYAWRNQFDYKSTWVKDTPMTVPTKGNHVGTYRREIVIPEGWSGKQIVAHFGSASSNIYLWINGRFVGYSEDSKLEAEFDITKFVTKGKNLIAFQIFRWCDGTYLEDQDLFRLSGVGRDCYLYARNAKQRVQDIRVTPDLDDSYNNGWINVDLDVVGKGAVELELRDAKGEMIAQKSVAGGAKRSVRIDVESPAKWSAEQPNLYTLTATTGGETIPVKVGFRKIEIKRDQAQIWVNGKAVLFKGVNRHEINPDKGFYLSREDMIRDIKVIKELNFNAVRTCHYPDINEWYDLCDEYGLYVVAEANLESHGMGYGKETPAQNIAYATAHMERNMRNVQRGFNHPSITFWSMGNEAGFGENFKSVYNWIKSEDPSRPVQYEQAKREPFTDVFCPMYYDYANSEKYLKSGDQRPLIQCEYAHAMGNSMGGFKDYWDLTRKYPNYQGGFIWDFADQSLRAEGIGGVEIYAYGGDFNNYDATDNNFCNNGVVSPDRVPNPHATEVKYVQQSIWATPLDLKKGEISIFNENFFIDLSNYDMEWSILADGEMIERGVISTLNVAPQSSATIKLDYSMDALKANEVVLNLEFKTKRREGLVDAGFVVAYEQLEIQPYTFAAIDLSKIKGTTPMVDDNDVKYLRVEGDLFTVDINRKDGFISRYRVDGEDLIEHGGALRPNFWRAPTDNDLGDNEDKGIKATKSYLIWKEPTIELRSLTHSQKGGAVEVVAEYNMPEVKSTLSLTYLIAADGSIGVSQALSVDKGAKISEMFRFGMQVALVGELSNINYYGRGPEENYFDRKESTKLGLYTQKVADQYYPYIRPQESGAKSDVRWWQLLKNSGDGVEIYSDAPFIATARDYSQESLDDGIFKGQRHSPEIERCGYTELSIDNEQMGLGCLNSWGKKPQAKYWVRYNDKQFNFVIRPVLNR